MSDVLNTSHQMRLNGLMKHLKNNSAWEDHQKQVLLAEEADKLVPEEYDETIRNEFERRCAFGERMNTEFMSSAKWVKLLRDIGVLLPPGMSGKAAAASGRPAILQAEADIIFHKVLHNCDHGGQRLTYELFCKALYLAAQAILPDFQGEAAFGEILAQVIAVAPPPSAHTSTARGQAGDPMLDARVLLVLDHFKPALHDMFRNFCGRNLCNPAWASPGSGIQRARQRSTMRHTQETLCCNTTSGTLACGSASLSRSASQPYVATFEAASPALTSASPTADPRLSRLGKEVPAAWEVSPRDLAEDFGEGAGTGSAGGLGSASMLSSVTVGATGGVSPPHLSPSRSIGSLYSPRNSAANFHLDNSPIAPQGSYFNDFGASIASGSPRAEATKTEYANGSPVIKDRRQNMSVDQLLDWCKELKMMPNVLTRVEVVRIFKRAQTTGFPGSHGSGVHGFLSREAFVDAVGQLALEAYSKEPFCDEYVEAHEKICAFLLDYLPGNSRETERLLTGCSPPRR